MATTHIGQPASDGPGTATIADVARIAGVSTATVSRVMSGTRPVRKEYADRVFAAADQLDYQPNAAARGLSTGSLRHIGLVMPQLSNPYFAEIIERLSRRAAESGYRLIITDAGDSTTGESSAAHDLSRQTDGLILLSPRMPAQQLRSLGRSGRPLVLVNRVDDRVNATAVAVDNFRSMTRLCGHLSALGHRHIAYLSGPSAAWQDQERWRALLTAQDLGLTVTRIEGDGRIETASQATDRIISSQATALVCFNDLSAIGAINSLEARGVHCPQDISVTGFDGISMASYLQPPLTTVAVDKVEIADQAWQALMGRISGQSIPEPNLLPGKLLIRSSTSQATTLQDVG